MNPSAKRHTARTGGIPVMALNGLVVSTLYWSQASVTFANASFGSSPYVGLMPGATLAGYAVGVAAQAVWIRDLTSHKGLAAHTFLLTIGLLLAATAPVAPVAVLASLIIGIGCSLTQRLLAVTACTATPSSRAGAIGILIACGLLGVVAARAALPILMAEYGWRTVFLLASSIFLASSLTVLKTAVPRVAAPNRGPPAVLPTVATLWRRSPILRQSALVQAGIFAAFNAGWALYPGFAASHQLPLAGPACAVALLGAAAALCAGSACRRVGALNVAASGIAALFLAALMVPAALLAMPVAAHAGMALLDAGTQLGLVANHARVQAQDCPAEHRSRMAAMLTTIAFVGGAMGAIGANLLL